MTANACTLRIHMGKTAHRVAEVINDQAQDCPPLLAWAEPNPLYVEVTGRTGQRGDVVSLQRGKPFWPVDLPLIEARLFWQTAALHVVMDEDGGCIWTRIAEDETTDTELLVMRSEIPVHTRSDMKRFGLIPAADALLGLRAIEYRQRGRLIAWRLTIAEKEICDA